MNDDLAPKKNWEFMVEYNLELAEYVDPNGFDYESYMTSKREQQDYMIYTHPPIIATNAKHADAWWRYLEPNGVVNVERCINVRQFLHLRNEIFERQIIKFCDKGRESSWRHPFDTNKRIKKRTKCICPDCLSRRFTETSGIRSGDTVRCIQPSNTIKYGAIGTVWSECMDLKTGEYNKCRIIQSYSKPGAYILLAVIEVMKPMTVMTADEKWKKVHPGDQVEVLKFAPAPDNRVLVRDKAPDNTVLVRWAKPETYNQGRMSHEFHRIKESAVEKRVLVYGIEGFKPWWWSQVWRPKSVDKSQDRGSTPVRQQLRPDRDTSYRRKQRIDRNQRAWRLNSLLQSGAEPSSFRRHSGGRARARKESNWRNNLSG